MFTGIVEEVGRVHSVTTGARGGRRLRVAAARVARDAFIGDSIAVDGVCLTVVELPPDGFAVDVIGTTLSRSTLGSLAAGDRVNLEGALALGERLGGHLVQGHVDGVGIVDTVRTLGEHVLVDVRMPPEVAEVTVPHGSITVAGVSLTVNALPAPGIVQVALIPHTMQVTNLDALAPGARVNLEGDMLGRFVVEYLRRREHAAGAP
jgi:riboflavin synthase